MQNRVIGSHCFEKRESTFFSFKGTFLVLCEKGVPAISGSVDDHALHKHMSINLYKFVYVYVSVYVCVYMPYVHIHLSRY